MLRSLFAIFAIFCVSVLLAEGIFVGYLWYGGTLNATTLREIRLAMQGQPDLTAAEMVEESQVETPSQDEVREARLVRVLELDARANELAILKRMTSDTANQLISDRQAFDQMKTEFRAELEQLQERNRSEATEQIRTVLLATPPEDAVQRLMGLEQPEAVELLKGLPEKTIARILLAFQADEKAAPRGQELFEALYHGEPSRALIEETLQQTDPSAAGASRRAG
jgi:flagellar motility protein MotE (MotC chaperone)